MQIAGATVTLDGKKGKRVEPLLMAKYPVNYRPSKAFLDHWHGDAAARWGTIWSAHARPGSSIGRRQLPAETVSWYDAMAFCRWLSERLGYEVRLPSEMEWQQASTGGNAKNQYPWGSHWVEGCANTGESRLGRNIAVGMHPRGASAQEAPDPCIGSLGKGV